MIIKNKRGEKKMKLKINGATKRRCILRGRVFDFWRAEFKSGKKTEYVKHPGAIAAVPVLSNGKIVLIRQWRFAVGRYLWEIPAGTLEKGESIISCLKREVAEETGFCVKKILRFGFIYPCPGYSNEKIHLFIVHCDSRVKKKLDEDEHMWYKEFTKKEILSLLKENKIIDGKSQAALFRFFHDKP